ncbi:VTT domain-containing protein [Leuconostocaceae bacterium ESL0723]|nr:VTT domain-containing protein [Leuconostocaceae bacterium ESL0723]
MLTLGIFTDWINHLIAASSHFGWVEFVIFFALIFIETAGIVTGFIPADALVMTTASLAGTHHNLQEFFLLILIFGSASFCGDSVNYWFGAFIVKQIDRIPAVKKHLNGDFANQISTQMPESRWLLFVVLGRFIPFVRTVVPLMAHRLGLAYSKYVKMALAASSLWATVLVSIGYFAGHLEIPQNIKLAVAAVLVVLVVFIIRQPRFRQLVLKVLIGTPVKEPDHK